jgi:hypothetical protein
MTRLVAFLRRELLVLLGAVAELNADRALWALGKTDQLTERGERENVGYVIR